MSKLSPFMSLLPWIFFLLVSCTPATPHHVDNICSIFKQYPKWYRYAKKAERRFGVPLVLQMAVIHQESHFDATARPERRHLLWVIPWLRPSSSYGYAQALKPTWMRYQHTPGHHWASRDDIEDAFNFIGWYSHQLHRRLGVPTYDVYAFYLAYHEGIGGYARRTYLKKPWLIHLAHKVSRRAQIYERQLKTCEGPIKRRLWWLW